MNKSETMNKRYLITGGAGFIGRHLTDRLLDNFNPSSITILDNLSPQIHGDKALQSVKFPDGVNFVHGNILDRDAVARAINGVDIVFHLAAETGTGQSMYEASRYINVNIEGTANLFETIQATPNHNISRVVLSSSRAIYGEGEYLCPEHGIQYPTTRNEHDLKGGDFHCKCPICGLPSSPVPTRISAPKSPMSVYGLTKLSQEQLTHLMAKSIGIEAVALRYQNVYGPGQSLKNPYTGLLAVFSNMARAGKDLSVFEDGQESRDFVYVDDVVRATASASHIENVAGSSFNIGTGVPVTIEAVANLVTKHFGSKSSVKVTGAYRVGDIRHAIADLNGTSALLGDVPMTQFSEGVTNFLNWAGNEASESPEAFERSMRELTEKGLYHEKK